MGHRSCFKDMTDQIYLIYACTDTNHVRHFTASHRFMVHFVVAGSKGFPLSLFFFYFPNLKGIIYITKLCNKKYRSLCSFKSWKSSYLFTRSIDLKTIPCSPDYVIFMRSTGCAVQYWGITLTSEVKPRCTDKKFHLFTGMLFYKNKSNSTRALIGHKTIYMSVCKHGFRSSIISYFIKEM